MSQFLETICIKNGHPLHLDWHQRRVDVSLKHFYPAESIENISFQLVDILAACDMPSHGLYRCRTVYDLNAVSLEFFPYENRSIQSLCLIEAPSSYDYRYKYSDRKVLEELLAQRGDADDILITRDGWITDTSMANIAFQKNGQWYTPAFPLLAGTTWKRLVSTGMLIPRPIHQNDITRFDTFRLFNAMNEWHTGIEYPICSIIVPLAKL